MTHDCIKGRHALLGCSCDADCACHPLDVSTQIEVHILTAKIRQPDGSWWFYQSLT